MVPTYTVMNQDKFGTGSFSKRKKGNEEKGEVIFFFFFGFFGVGGQKEKQMK